MAAAVAAGESGREIRSPVEIRSPAEIRSPVERRSPAEIRSPAERRSPAAAAGRGRQAGSACAKLCTGGTHDEPTDERDLGLPALFRNSSVEGGAVLGTMSARRLVAALIRRSCAARSPGKMESSPDEECNRRSSAVISGHQRSSAVISGHRRSSAVISGHQRSSAVISDHQRSSAVISGHQRLEHGELTFGGHNGRTLVCSLGRRRAGRRAGRRRQRRQLSRGR